jgi:hypothetical protein
MAVTFLIIAAVLACASYTSFSAAANIAHATAPNWAFHICTQNPLICGYPFQTAYAAAALGTLALVMVLLSFFRNRRMESPPVTIERIMNPRSGR